MIEILAEAWKNIDIDIYMSDLKGDKLPIAHLWSTSVKMKQLWLFIVNTLILEELQKMVDKIKQDNEERYI